MPGVFKMIKCTLKILQHLLQDYQHVFDHFMGTRPYRVYKFIIKIDNNSPQNNLKMKIFVKFHLLEK